jgi:hypothetical protein
LCDKAFSWLQIITIHFATATEMKTDLFDTLLHIVNVGSLEVIAVGGAARNAATPPLPKYKTVQNIVNVGSLMVVQCAHKVKHAHKVKRVAISATKSVKENHYFRTHHYFRTIIFTKD